MPARASAARPSSAGTITAAVSPPCPRRRSGRTSGGAIAFRLGKPAPSACAACPSLRIRIRGRRRTAVRCGRPGAWCGASLGFPVLRTTLPDRECRLGPRFRPVARGSRAGTCWGARAGTLFRRRGRDGRGRGRDRVSRFGRERRGLLEWYGRGRRLGGRAARRPGAGGAAQQVLQLAPGDRRSVPLVDLRLDRDLPLEAPRSGIVNWPTTCRARSRCPPGPPCRRSRCRRSRPSSRRRSRSGPRRRLLASDCASRKVGPAHAGAAPSKSRASRRRCC